MQGLIVWLKECLGNVSVFVCWQPVPTSDKEVIARLRNCVLALANYNMMLYDTSVMYAYEASAQYQVTQTRCTRTAGKLCTQFRCFDTVG